MNYAEIKEIEARGLVRGREQGARLGRALLTGTGERCHKCTADLGPQVDGDVTMCTRCGQWHHTWDVPGDTRRITRATTGRGAAALAREPVDHDRLFWAMDKAAAAMRIEAVRDPLTGELHVYDRAW